MDVNVRLRILHPKQELIRASTAKRKIVKAGRRGGKTTFAGDITVEEFLDGRRVLYAVPTADQLTKWWFEVQRALKEPIQKKVFRVNETMKIIERPGTENRIRGKTAWNAQTLRGDYADFLILDELQSMSEDVWDEVGAPMLLDNNGNALFIFTPPSIQSRSASKARNKLWAIDFFNKHAKDTTGRWETFSFTSFDNPHISRDALDEITKDMSSMSYRQEILAESMKESPGALWKRDTIENTRVTDRPVEFARIGVAVDPSQTTGGDEAGIIAGGMRKEINSAGKEELHYYVLEDRSVQASPLEWAKKAVLLYYELDADYLVAEKNAGGEMIGLTLKNAAEHLKKSGDIPSDDIRLLYVTATRGKQVRADPVSAMYERGLVHHVGNFYDLEDELCLWTPLDKSPNRLDALVWLMTLLKNAGSPSMEDIEKYSRGSEIDVDLDMDVDEDIRLYAKGAKEEKESDAHA